MAAAGTILGCGLVCRRLGGCGLSSRRRTSLGLSRAYGARGLPVGDGSGSGLVGNLRIALRRGGAARAARLAGTAARRNGSSGTCGLRRSRTRGTSCASGLVLNRLGGLTASPHVRGRSTRGLCLRGGLSRRLFNGRRLASSLLDTRLLSSSPARSRNSASGLLGSLRLGTNRLGNRLALSAGGLLGASRLRLSRLLRADGAGYLRLNVRRGCLRGTSGSIARTRYRALSDYPLHLGELASLRFQTIDNATRTAINDDDPDHQQDDGESQNHQAYDDQGIGR